MKLSLAAVVSASFGIALSSANRRIPSNLKQYKLSSLPDTGEHWSTLENGVEYQPAANLSPAAEEHLRRMMDEEYRNGKQQHRNLENNYNVQKQYSQNGAYNYNPNYNSNNQYTGSYVFNGSPSNTQYNEHANANFDTSMSEIYVDGAETIYDDYAQAWRVLGFYIDCEATSGEAEEGGAEQNDQNNGNMVGGCQRYLLWAAYIDEEYMGGGVNEYMYYDRRSGLWSDKACVEGSRCVKMDCHMSNTHFSLLGFFKEPNYDEWMEQLFKHEGDCVWTDDEYEFMQAARQSWPTGCTESIYTVDERLIYYDVKPKPYGSMGIGLYTDQNCITPYEGDLTPEYVLKGMVCGGFVDGGDQYDAMCNGEAYEYGGGGDSSSIYDLQQQLETWNDAFDVFKQCLPCKAFSLTNVVAGMGYEANSDGSRYDNRRLNEDEEDDFTCNDDAGYEDVNQCMKFASKTNMMTATWREVEVAGTQGSLTGVSIVGRNNTFFGEKKWWQSSASNSKQARESHHLIGRSLDRRNSDTLKLARAWLFLSLSILLFGLAGCRYKSLEWDLEEDMEEPLFDKGEGYVA